MVVTRWYIRRGSGSTVRYLVDTAAVSDAMRWGPDLASAVRFESHESALTKARVIAAEGETVAVLPLEARLGPGPDRPAAHAE